MTRTRSKSAYLVDMSLFLKRVQLISIFLIFTHFPWAAIASESPNILFIMTDDQGRWKLVRCYQKDFGSSPKDYWYDPAHPLGERFSVPPPSKSQQLELTTTLEKFFATYETKEHSGGRIWELPRQNAG